MNSMKGKVAIVTGSGRRMGRAIAIRLAELGCDVVVNAKSSQAEIQEVAARIEELGCRALPILCDVTNEEDVQRLVRTTTKVFGRIDILVNNVATRTNTPIKDLTTAEWRRVLASILDSAFFLCRECEPELRKNRGTIINIGGAAAHFGHRDSLHVMTAKAGLVGMTRALAIDLAPEVVANCVIPGRVEHPDDVVNRAGKLRYDMSRIPAGRAGTVEEIAECVAMLCSDKNRFISGQSIHVNGAMYFGS